MCFHVSWKLIEDLYREAKNWAHRLADFFGGGEWLSIFELPLELFPHLGHVLRAQSFLLGCAFAMKPQRISARIGDR